MLPRSGSGEGVFRLALFRASKSPSVSSFRLRLTSGHHSIWCVRPLNSLKTLGQSEHRYKFFVLVFMIHRFLDVVFNLGMTREYVFQNGSFAMGSGNFPNKTLTRREPSLTGKKEKGRHFSTSRSFLHSHLKIDASSCFLRVWLFPPHPGMVRASQTRRSDGGTQSGTRRSENSNRTPASRNRNPNHDEDSNPDPRNGSNSNSASTRGTAPEPRPEPRPEDSDRGSTDVRGRRSRSNTDRDGSEDPGNRKRKLYEDITDAVSSGSLFKKLNSGYAFFLDLI